MTKETKDLGAATPHSPFQEWAMAAGRAALVAKGSTAQLQVLTEAMAAAYASGLERAAQFVSSVPHNLNASLASGIRAVAAGTAPQAPPDSVSALLEARRLLGQAQRWLPKHQYELQVEIRAFLRSDSERSEPARSESGGSKVVHDPSEGGR